MRGGDARRQVGEERRDLGGDAQPRVGLAHARQILVARLLGEQQPRAQRRVEPLDRRRHDLGHDARALAAAEHQQAQRARPAPAAANGVAAAAITAGRTGLPVRVALAASAGSRVEHAGEAGRDRGHARRQQPVGAAHHGVLLVDDGRDLQHRRGARPAAASDSRRSRPRRRA